MAKAKTYVVATKRNRRVSARLSPIVWNDIVPLVSGRSGDESDDRFGVAHVEHFVRHAGLDVNEIARLVLQDLFQARPELMPDFSFEDVEDQLEANVDMRVSHAPRRNRRD